MADVYPVKNGLYVQFVVGIPAEPHLGISDKEAKELVATGAFTYDKPPPEKASSPSTKAPDKPGPSDSPSKE